MTKAFKIGADQVRRLVPPLGGAFASDRILVDGRVVGFMERSEPSYEDDSGWSFLSGYESEEELNDPDQAGIYEVNTIANYDPEILPFLGYPVGTRVSRPEPGAPLQIDEGPPEPPEMTFLLPWEAGQEVTFQGGWTLTPPEHFLRRFQEGSLVLWRPGATCYFELFDASPELETEAWVKTILEAASPERSEEARQEGPPLKLEYLLVDEGQPGRYGFARAGTSVLHWVGYFDDPESEALVRGMWASLGHAGP